MCLFKKNKKYYPRPLWLNITTGLTIYILAGGLANIISNPVMAVIIFTVIYFFSEFINNYILHKKKQKVIKYESKRKIIQSRK
jgi:hypothetical protein